MQDNTRLEKLNIMKMLNWDYLDNPEDMLAVIEGRLETSGVFTKEKLFLRSIERLPWHQIVELWGVEKIKELYTYDIAKRIWPKERKCHYDFAVSILRREAVPAAGWGDEYYRKMWRPFLSDRWYSIEQGLLQSSLL